MNLDFSLLSIERIILHELPKRYKADPPDPILSDVESDLNSDLKAFLQERYTSTLVQKPFDVRFDESIGSMAPGCIHSYLLGQSEFVRMSRELASGLAQVQTGIAKASLLAVTATSVGRHHGIAIAKIEREEGLNLSQSTDVNGNKTFNLEHLKSLMFSGNTKLYKIAHFAMFGDRIEDIYGVVAEKIDGQINRKSVSTYFLRDFLACRYAESPELATERWFQSASNFLDSDDRDPRVRTEAFFAIQAEMTSNRDDLNVNRFANDHLPVNLRRAFADHMVESGFDRGRSIPKDTARIARQLYGIEWQFASGVKLIAKGETAKDHVDIVTLDDGAVRATVTDRLNQIKAN